MKHDWRQRWLSSLNELTSFDLQKKSWLDPKNTNPHWSYVEFTSTYFDDLLIDNGYQYLIDREFLTKEEYEIIRDWHKSLEDYEEPNGDIYNHSAILNDTKWHEIVNTGEKVKNQLVIILNAFEKQLLTEEKYVI